jgi:antitoxin (DNA-binding transcriptional repressor) of toxin-antitoxin stability system
VNGLRRFLAAKINVGMALETTSDYRMVMTSIGTAALKAHLSEHLQAVRRGETIIVLDRREPIARIVPIGAAGLVIRQANGSIHDVPFPGPCVSDVMQQLRKERAERL